MFLQAGEEEGSRELVETFLSAGALLSEGDICTVHVLDSRCLKCFVLNFRKGKYIGAITGHTERASIV